MISRPRQSTVGQDELPDFSREELPDDQERTPLEFDDGPWEAFLPDDGQLDPLPEPGDFWIESDEFNSRLLAA